ncbi:MAG TPA: imidazole glycerol phosphate synthase subunit HisH [Methylomirabilota bacterium]|nr:imidazole glycerol phosphate synthase subunit HisH [Methylomirabilota bacterium]
MSAARPVVIVDYGRGNLWSVCQAVAAAGGAPCLSDAPAAVRDAERLILPGVGAFGDAMAGLRARGLDEAVRSFAATERPLLGVCLGMQLLLESSTEFGHHAGLALVAGRVDRLPTPDPGARDKIPNVGWCRLEPAAGGGPWSDSLLSAVKPGDFAYFVHSYAAHPADPRHRLADIEFAGGAVAAAIAAGPISGCQFHPEKSGEVGLAILRAFVAQA